MKLPLQRKRGVASLGTYDVSGPGRVVRAENAVLKSAANAVYTGVDLYNQIEEAKLTEGAEANYAKMIERAGSTFDTLSNTEIFNLEDPDTSALLMGAQDDLNLDDGMGGTRTTVENHEVLGSAWNRQLEQIKKDAMQGMTPFQQDIINKKSQEKFLQMNRLMAKQQLLSTTKAMKAGVESRAQKLQEDGELGLALTELYGSKVHTKPEIQEMAQKLSVKDEVEFYSRAMISDDVEQMKLAERAVSNPEYKGSLDDNKRMVVANKLRAAIKRKEGTKEGIDKAWKASVIETGKQMTKAIGDGFAVPPNAADAIDNLVAVGNFSEAAKLRQAIVVSNHATNISRLPLPDQEPALIAIKATATNPAQYNMATSVGNTVRKKREAIRKDSMQAAQDTGEYDVEPIDWNPPDRETFREDLTRRYNDAVVMQKQTGEISGYFSKEETTAFNARMENMSRAEKTAMIEDVNAAFGQAADNVWAQMQIADTASTNAKAGEISNYMIAGSNYVSDSVLEGFELLKENPNYLDSHKNDLRRSDPHMLLNTVYGHGPRHKQVMSAARARYAHLNSLNPSAEFSEDLYDQAVQDVTGGIVNILGKPFEAPVAGMPEDDIDEWLDNMTPAYIAGIGFPTGGWSPERLAAAIRDGQVISMPSGGRNAFALAWRDNPGQPIMDLKTDKPFVMRYDSELYSRTIHPAATQAEEQVVENDIGWLESLFTDARGAGPDEL